MLNSIKHRWRQLKSFYQASAENRLQIILFIGFMIVPILGMSLFFLYVYNFLL